MKLHLPVPNILALSVCAAGACTFLSAPCWASNVLAVDVESGTPSDSVPDASSGFGVGVRFGHEWHPLILSLTPEFGASYRAFSGLSDADAFTVVAGGRVGLGFILEPSVYAHAGLGHFSYGTPAGEASATGLGYDVGAALDFTALPAVDFGVHATLAGIGGDSDTADLAWLALGAHIEFELGEGG